MDTRMKKLLFLLLALTVSAPAFAQTQTQYYTVPTIAALKAMTTSRPAVVQVVDANPGIFNLSTGACSAADDIFQVQPTGGTTVCYTRAATPYSVGKSATANGVLVTSAGGVPSISTTLPAITAGAGLVTSTGSTTARSLALRFATTYNVKDFGAVGDGSTDDAAAFNAAFTACEAATYGCEIYIPSGTFALGSKITKSMTKAVTIRGQGRGVSTLLWTNSSGGFDLTFSTQYNAPKIYELTILTSYAGGGTAITITESPASASSNDIGPEVTSVDIRGSDTATKYWTNGISLVDVWYPVLSNFAIKGKDETVLPFSMASGVSYTRSQVLFMHHFSMQHMEDAVLQVGTTFGEGLNMTAFELVGVRRGVNMTSWVAGAVAIDGFSNGHINSYEYGIKANYVHQANFSGMLIYKTHISASNYVGVEITNAEGWRIADSFISDSPTATGTYTGVSLVTANENTVSNNSFNYSPATSTAISIGTSSARNTVSGNTSGVGGGASLNTVVIASGAGAGNSVRGNLSNGGYGLVNNSTAVQYFSGNYPASGTIELAYTSANSLQIPSVIRNNNAGSPTAALGFNVASTAAGDTSVSKGGIGFTRNGAQGQGYGALYNQGTGAATDFTTANEILRWTGTGVSITGTTTISGITSIGKTTAPVAGILGIKAGTNQNIEVRGGITDATAITINAVNDAGAGSVPLELLGSRITVAAALRYGGVDLSNSVTGTGSMVLSASPTLTGTLTMAAANAATTSALCFNTGTGVVTYNSTVGTCTVSALAYKVPGQPIANGKALASLVTMRTDGWTYKKLSGLDDREHVGLYADDVAKLDKRCAIYKDGKIENYDDRCVLAYTIAAMKELKAANDNLKAEIAELKKKVR